MVPQISPVTLQKTLQNRQNILLLDVREPYEFEVASIPGSVLIPLGEIQHRLDELQAYKTKDIAVICHHGIRSQHVADFLIATGFQHIFNLTGGIDAWSRQCDTEVPRY